MNPDDQSTDWLESDPAAIFAQPNPRHDLLATILGGLAFGTLAAVISYAFLSSDESEKGPSPFAYVMITAVDDTGRVVPGARVELGGRPSGRTDSFGEWRQFIRVPMGERLQFLMTKRRGDRLYSGLKTVSIPSHVPSSGDFQIQDRVRMVEIGPAKTAKRTQPVVANKRSPSSARGRSTATSPLEIVAGPSLPLTAASDVVDMENLHEKIAPQMVRLAKRATKTSGPMRVRLTHMPLPGKSRGQIQVTVARLTETFHRPYSFLNEYKASSKETALLIWQRIEQWAAQGPTQCRTCFGPVQPVAGWIKRPVKVRGSIAAGTKVFVGQEEVTGAKNKRWAWTPRQGRLPVTVVGKQGVVSRKVLRLRPRKATLSVPIPSKRLARKVRRR